MIHQVTLLVFRSRRGLSLRPINRIKHVVDSQDGITAGTTLFKVLVDTVDAPVLANTDEVITGSTINGIYLKVEINATSSAALANAYMYVAVNPGNTLTLPAPNAVGAFEEKRFIIHQEMVMLQQQTNSNPRTLFNGVIVVPKGLRRMSPNTRINLVLLAPGVNLNSCLQCHYKEFR